MWSNSIVPPACRNAMVSGIWTTFGSRWFYKVGKMWQMFLSLPHHMLTECIQNHYWALSLYVFRLQAVIFPYFIIDLFIFISFPFSSDIIGNEKKKRRGRPPKGPAKPRMVGASHYNKDVNQWKEPVMKELQRTCGK